MYTYKENLLRGMAGTQGWAGPLASEILLRTFSLSLSLSLSPPFLSEINENIKKKKKKKRKIRNQCRTMFDNTWKSLLASYDARKEKVTEARILPPPS